MISQDSLHPPSFSRSVSQESLDSASMEDYWSEVKSIEESAENRQDEHAVLEVKSADEGELEEAWLQEAGLSTLVSGSPREEPAEALFSTLTRTQAAVVKKRIDNYTQMQRKKKPVRDVRDIFAVENSPVKCRCSNPTRKDRQRSTVIAYSTNYRLDRDTCDATSQCSELLNISYQSDFHEDVTASNKINEIQTETGKDVWCISMHQSLVFMMFQERHKKQMSFLLILDRLQVNSLLVFLLSPSPFPSGYHRPFVFSRLALRQLTKLCCTLSEVSSPPGIILSIHFLREREGYITVTLIGVHSCTTPLPSHSQSPSRHTPSWPLLESCASNCKLSKDSPSLPEELNFDVPYSECALRKDCRSIQRIKKDDATFPKFLIRKAKLGLTVVGDLSQEDMKKIGYISLIELTAYFDALGIELKRNRTVKSKVRDYGLFGVPLTTLLENDQKKFPGSKVPLIFKKLLCKLEQTGLQTEGILRVPGSASRVKSLRQELEEKFYEDTFEWDLVRHNDAAGLLKMFIRELPYPLLTVEYLPAFIAVENISPSKLQLQALHLLIMLLPEPNRDTLKALLEFLSKVVDNEEKNRMSLWNVSMIVAPNLFMCKGKTANPQEMQDAAGAAHVVRLLVKHQDILWTVSTEKHILIGLTHLL
ncbi:RHG18 protein, partial [Polyodon spathula]|nr:RHG18 protein [Polyodon spathula]